VLKEQLNIVLPVENGIKRPKWSVMIPTFNPKEHFLIQAINSVLVQDLGPDKMQIEVVDDCSTKVDVEKIVNDNWKGRVKYHRLEKNVGHSFNFTESVRRAIGDLVHLLHDDDKVKPGFYLKFESVLNKFEEAGAVFCRQEYIDDDDKSMFFSEPEMDEAGILDNALIKLAEKQRIQYCAMVVKRKVYEEIGGYIPKNIGCEDWEMWVRIAANFKIAYEPKALAQYRIHRTSMTLTDMRTGQDMRFLREAAEIFTQYLPKEKRKEVTLKRNKHYAVYSFDNAKRMFKEFNDEEGAAAQLSETIKLDSEFVFKNLDFLKKFTYEIDSAGVSVVICTDNDEGTIESTIRSLKNQIVHDYIPWEVVLIDNGSIDNTLKLAAESLKTLPARVSYRIIEEKQLSIFKFRSKAIESAKYNFVLFCNPGNFLNRFYVNNASENMLKESDTGALGGFAEYESSVIPPPWFNKNTYKYYHIGEQYDNSTDITWSKGYVWGSGMVIRKEAWQSLIRKNFNSVDTHSKYKIYSSLFVKKLCFALRLDNWRIRYSVELSLNKFIDKKEFSWKYIRELQRQNGINSVILSHYPDNQKTEIEDFRLLRMKTCSRKLIKVTCRKLRSYNFRKLISYKDNFENDLEIPEIEFQIGKLYGLLNEIKSYNERIRILKRYSYKRDFKYLKFAITNPYFKFPKYFNTDDRIGLSVIIDFKNTSYDLLFKSLDKIAGQKLPENFPLEVLISYTRLDFEIKEKTENYWSRLNSSAKLIFFEESDKSQTEELPFSLKAQSASKYEYLLFLNEKNFISPDFVRIAYKIINSNNDTGIVFGKTEFGRNLNPPKWFSSYKKYFGIGQEPENAGVIKDSGYPVNPYGIVIRKEILNLNSLNGISDLSELSYAVIENGFNIRYEPRLNVKKYISAKEFSWDYVRALNFKIGTENAKNGKLTIAGSESKTNGASESHSWIYKANKTFSEIRKFPYKKIFSEKDEYVNDTEVLEIEKLKGELKEIFRAKGNGKELSHDLTKRINGNGNKSINRNGSAQTGKLLNGVSILICCYNSSDVIVQTLEFIFRQKNTDGIPWEIIVVDNASTDNTAQISQDLRNESNCLTPFKIVNESVPGLSAARQKGIKSAKYEYVVFCDDDNRLEENFVRNTFDIMRGNSEIGILGGFGKAEYETFPKSWFNDWKNSFAIGEQSEIIGDITWTRGFVWGAAMVIRKNAWEKSLANGFKSKLTDRKGNTLSAGGDTEICYALRNNGWKIWYDPKLIFTHYITSERLNWTYLRNLFRGFGNASSGLDEYLKKIPVKTRKEKRISVPGSARAELRKSLISLRKTRYRKLLSYKRRREGQTDIPFFEYTLGRINSLIKTKGTYNSGLKLLKKVARKKDFKYLSPAFRINYPEFPRYKTEKKLNGVSVIVCTYNGADRLAETVKHIANQKVDKNILWEFILVDNASSDNSKEVTKEEWDKHKCNAKLKIVDQPIPGKQLALEKGYEVAKYEYWLTCDDDNWLDENFVQLTYEIMSGNDKIGVLGGPNEALCELEPPEWFQWFKKDYAAGPQGDIYTGKVSDGDITWKRGFVWGAGMVVRKSAWEKLLADGFRTSMSCRKGTELSSGGDSEACYALVLAGWHVWYDKRLKLKHCMPAGRLDWNYLVRLFSGFGVATVGLELYEKAIKLGYADIDKEEILKKDWKYEFRKAIGELRKYGIKKILSLRHSNDNDTQIPMLEFYLSKVKELWRDRKEYDRKFQEIINATWVKNFSEMKAEHRKFLESENDFRYGWPWNDEPVSVIDGDENNKTKYPKISILSPSFNSAGTIEKAILSVLKQGYPNFEHIICDAGSNDGTIEILKKYPHLKWVSEPDKGQSDAMNKAFNMSTGDVISYLNVDDYYQRGAFKKIAKAFETSPESEMIIGNLFFEYGDHTYTRTADIEYKKIMLPFKYMFPINPVSYFYRRNVQTEIGPFPLDNHMTMDYWFLLKAYQNHKLYKIEDYLGTFCMNGYNKTSGADNRKNTHDRVVYHCWNYDKKNLPYYLYNYYKFFHYDKKSYNLTNIGNKLRKNAGRVISVLTFKKNKYYNQKLYIKARNSFYANNRFKATALMLTSYIIYPKAVKQSSRSIILSYSLFGMKKTEKIKWFYFFLTTPPGLPLANKLHYYGNKYKDENKSTKGNILLFLTYLISPKFFFKPGRPEEKTASESKLRFINPFYWLKSFINYFRYKKYKEISYEYYLKAGERYFHHKHISGLYYFMLGFLVYPLSVMKKSKISLLTYLVAGTKNTENLKFLYHIYKDNPELTLAHKLNYFGNEYKKEGENFKGNFMLFVTYILSPKYIFRQESKPEIVKSPENKFMNVLSYLNPFRYLKNLFDFFRFKKYREKSYNYFIKANERYYFHKNIRALYYLILSFIVYPLSVTKKSRMSLLLYSGLGNKNTENLKFAYHLYKDNPEYSFAHKLDYYGNELRQEGNSFKGNSILLFAYILNPKYISRRKKLNKSKRVFASEFRMPEKKASYNPMVWIKDGKKIFKAPKNLNLDIGKKMRDYPEILRYRLVRVYHYFRYRKFKARSKELYSQAQVSYSINKRFDAVKLLIPSMLLYPPSIFNRNKLSLMLNSLKGNGSNGKLKEKE
jgi:glycosyltransferase involved in cell wall biosynthesis